MNQEKLNNILKKAILQVSSAGIKPGNIQPEVGKVKGVTTFGLCKKIDTPKGIEFSIFINPVLYANEDSLMETMIHEVLHTVDGCDNHGKLWVENANIMNNKYGYHISRCSSYEEKGLVRPDPKYKLKCNCCGNIYEKNAIRKKFIQEFNCYFCSCNARDFELLEKIGDEYKSIFNNKMDSKEFIKTRFHKKKKKTSKPKLKLSQPVVVLPHLSDCKYLICCENCKKQTGRKVVSKFVKNISKYKCACGGKLFLFENK